jgi:hypothetical protein
MTTSGAPVPAVIAVWSLSYSSPPAPAFVQQTWTSSCCSLKLSATVSEFGYQAHTVTTGRSGLGIVFVQAAESLPPPPSSGPALVHAAIVPASTRAAAAANSCLLFIEFPFGCWTSVSVLSDSAPGREGLPS